MKRRASARWNLWCRRIRSSWPIRQPPVRSRRWAQRRKRLPGRFGSKPLRAAPGLWGRFLPCRWPITWDFRRTSGRLIADSLRSPRQVSWAPSVHNSGGHRTGRRRLPVSWWSSREATPARMTLRSLRLSKRWGFMATVNYVIEESTLSHAVVTWENLLNGDVGQWFKSAGYFLQNSEASGTLGAGGTYIGENAQSVSNPVAIGGAQTAALPSVVSWQNSAMIRPRVSAGDGTTSITFSAYLTRLR